LGEKDNPLVGISAKKIKKLTDELSSQHNEGMDGPHNFGVYLKTNDPTNPDLIVNVLSNWIP
jgi:hypothetical protein